MSQKIDPREVLVYLNDLGYTNINAQQLKDFITDLKKLIKYESKHRQKENLDTVDLQSSPRSYVQTCNRNHDIPTYRTKNSEIYYCGHPFCPRNPANTTPNDGGQDVFSQLHSQHTVASRAKEIPRKEKQISVHIKKSKNKPEVHDHCTHFDKEPEDVDQRKADLQLIQNIETISDGSKLYVNTESTIKTIDTASKQSLPTKPSTAKKKSKCSFIRSTSTKTINKSDPVALYHYYQEQWKKQKFPGQEHHSDLRWSVREKMLGGPKIDMYPSSSTFRRRCNSWKG